MLLLVAVLLSLCVCVDSFMDRYPWGPSRPLFISKVGMLDEEGNPKYPDLDPDLGFYQCVLGCPVPCACACALCLFLCLFLCLWVACALAARVCASGGDWLSV